MPSVIITNVKEYYRLVTEVDIGAVARDLLGNRVVNESSDRLECDCPHHQSQSHRSLHVMLDKQGWYCFGCSQGGDVLQLVEFVQSGTATKNTGGRMPESHRRARDFLAARVGLPPLGRSGVDPEKLKEAEAARLQTIRVQETLTELARFYHQRLQETPKAVEWVKSKYGLTDETIDQLLIGYADNGPWKDDDGREYSDTFGFLMRDDRRELLELSATGAFAPSDHDSVRPFFDQRVVFPYWSRGRVVFMIGRATPWTPDNQWEKGKYKKLLVHNETTRQHVAPCVSNGYIYNEDCLLENPKRVIITEGSPTASAPCRRGSPASRR